MNRQTLILIIFAIVLLPLSLWSASQAEKLRKVHHDDWEQKHDAWYRWVINHPDKIKTLNAHDLAQLRGNLQWFEKHYPEVALEIAAVTSTAQARTNAGDTGPTTSVTGGPTGGTVPPLRAKFLEDLDHQKPEDWTLTTETMRVKLAAEGGTVETLTFLDDPKTSGSMRESSFTPVAPHDRAISELEGFQLLKTWDPGVRSFALESKLANEPLGNVGWLHQAIEGGHRFTRVLPDGDLVVTKEYLLAPPTKDNTYSDYHFLLRISVENRGEKSRSFNYSLLGPAGLIEPTTSSPLPLEAVIGHRDEAGGYATEEKAAADIWKGWKDKETPLKVQASGGTRIAFFGLAEKQFACVVMPGENRLLPDVAEAHPLVEILGKQPDASQEAALKKPNEPNIAREATVRATRSEYQIDSKATVTQEYYVFAGPLWKELLENHPLYAKANLGSLVSYPSWIPGVKWLAILLTKLLVGFHALTRSWGISIILLTLLVRAAMHPLMVKQTRSTQKMSSLSPEINKLKEKYQDKDGNMSAEDSKKFQAEQMELWKKHGINPLGCMGPMFLQLPIFYGLWNTLRYAFELRQSSFLWIRDLTEPDVVARLPFSLPMHATNALCILPIVMLVVYLVQMKTMPKPVTADPQQQDTQKIMQWMMPVMGYMFYSLQSGLLLYYITSSIIGMLEQRWIKKRLGIVAPGAAAPGVPARV